MEEDTLRDTERWTELRESKGKPKDSKAQEDK